MAVSWGDFESSAKEMAAFGKDRIDGKVAYLASVKRDGSPRAHPVTPIIGEGYCFLFVEPTSRKVRDLKDNGLYCLHCSMSDSSGSSGEFQISGIAQLIDDAQLRIHAENASSFRPAESYLLFELKIEEVLSTSYKGGRADRHIWNPDS